MDKKLPITAFDMLTINQTMQLYKAALPFLDFDLQKILSIIIRVNELKQTMNFYNCPKNYSSIRSCCNGQFIDINSSLEDLLHNEELINAIMPYCPENYVSIIKNYRQFSQMSDLFNIFTTTSDNQSDAFQSNSSDNSSDLSNDIPNNMSSDKSTNKSSESSSGNESGNSSDNGNIKSLLNQLLGPEQQKMYNEYLRQLDDLDISDKNKPNH